MSRVKDTLKDSIEHAIIESCSPTLASLKPGNLFLYRYSDLTYVKTELKKWKLALNTKGLDIVIMKECKKTQTLLIYLYRMKQIEAILKNENVQDFLKQLGYGEDRDEKGQNGGFQVKSFLAILSKKICLERDFPHEVGIILGYPLEDVIGFIQNSGQSYTLNGYWKTYGDPEVSKRKFNQFTKCTCEYRKMFLKGKSIIQLTVAA